jgi:hypothetical protein
MEKTELQLIEEYRKKWNIPDHIDLENEPHTLEYIDEEFGIKVTALCPPFKKVRETIHKWVRIAIRDMILLEDLE